MNPTNTLRWSSLVLAAHAACFGACVQLTTLTPQLLRVLMLVVSLVLGGCALPAQRLEPKLETPRLSIEPPAPQAAELMACFGRNFSRFVERPADGSPALVVQVASYANRNASALQRQEINSDATLLMQGLVSQIDPGVAFLARQDNAACDREPRAHLCLQGEISVVEAAAKSVSKGIDVAAFVRTGDVTARDGTQASLAKLTLELSGVDSQGLGRYGMAVPVQVVFERSFTRERSLAASITNVALGFNDTTRTVHSYGHALRLAAAVQLVTLLGRATRVPVHECLRTAGAEQMLDAVAVQGALEEFRGVMKQDGRAGRFWLNKLRAFGGREVREPFTLDEETAPTQEIEALPADSEVARYLAVQAKGDRPLTEHEKEYVYWWAQMPRLSAERFRQALAVVQELEARIAEQARATAESEARAAKVKPVRASTSKGSKAVPSAPAQAPAKSGVKLAAEPTPAQLAK